MTSRPAQQEQAWLVYCEGPDQVVKFEPAAHPIGTTVDICDIFFNTPARRKFLKAEKTEFAHIDELVKRIALSQPAISFKLIHNNKTVRHFPSAKQHINRIAAVCGKSFSDTCVALDTHYGDIHIRAWLSKPMQARTTNDVQYTFVNGRMMRDKLITHAIKQAYEGLISPQTFAGYVVFIDVPSTEVDVNVHPAKHEVRFVQARTVHDFIYQSVSDALQAGFVDGEAPDYTQVDVAHDYILPLQANEGKSSQVSNGTGRGAGSSGIASGHTSYGRGGAVLPNPHPGKTELSAYNQLLDTRAVGESQSVRAAHYMLLEDGTLLLQNQGLQACAADQLYKLLLNAYIAQSETPQPLLLPVAQGVQGEKLEQVPWQNLVEKQFLIEVVHHKCIVKKVPSLLRPLPWNVLLPAWLTHLKTAHAPALTELRVDDLLSGLAQACATHIATHTVLQQTLLSWLDSDPQALQQALHYAQPIRWEFVP